MSNVNALSNIDFIYCINMIFKLLKINKCRTEKVIETIWDVVMAGSNGKNDDNLHLVAIYLWQQLNNKCINGIFVYFQSRC